MSPKLDPVSERLGELTACVNIVIKAVESMEVQLDDHSTMLHEITGRPPFTAEYKAALEEQAEARRQGAETRRARQHAFIDKLFLAATMPVSVIFGAIGTIVVRKLGLA